MEKDKARCEAKKCKTEFIKPSYHNKNDLEVIMSESGMTLP